MRCLLLKDVCSWPSELAPLLPRLHNPKSSGFLVSAGGGRQLPPSPAGLPHSWAFRISWKKGSGLPVPEGVRPSWVPGPLSVSPTASHLSGGFLRPSCLGLSPCVLALFPFCGSFYLSLSSLQHLHPPLCRYVQQPSSCLASVFLYSFFVLSTCLDLPPPPLSVILEHLAEKPWPSGVMCLRDTPQALPHAQDQFPSLSRSLAQSGLCEQEQASQSRQSPGLSRGDLRRARGFDHGQSAWR